jgi:hypothetical protein
MSPGTTNKAASSEGPTVWAAEHGASTPDIGRGDDASNAGHSWRIHGRLDDMLEKEGGPAFAKRVAHAADASGRPQRPLDVESLRSLLAEQTEIDLRDVQLKINRGEVTLLGTVAHQGEAKALTEILQRQPGVVAVHERLMAVVA